MRHSYLAKHVSVDLHYIAQCLSDVSPHGGHVGVD